MKRLKSFAEFVADYKKEVEKRIESGETIFDTLEEIEAYYDEYCQNWYNGVN